MVEGFLSAMMKLKLSGGDDKYCAPVRFNIPITDLINQAEAF